MSVRVRRSLANFSASYLVQLRPLPVKAKLPPMEVSSTPTSDAGTAPDSRKCKPSAPTIISPLAALLGELQSLGASAQRPCSAKGIFAAGVGLGSAGIV